MTMVKLFIKKGVKIPISEEIKNSEKIEDVVVTFKCKGGPIGEVGTFFPSDEGNGNMSNMSFKIFFIKSINTSAYFSDDGKGKIKRIEKDVEFTKSEMRDILKLFSNQDFDPDNAQDLVITEPDCLGTWTETKIISVYNVQPYCIKSNISEPRNTYDFYQ